MFPISPVNVCRYAAPAGPTNLLSDLHIELNTPIGAPFDIKDVS